jgi:hypothetical protein
MGKVGANQNRVARQRLLSPFQTLSPRSLSPIFPLLPLGEGGTVEKRRERPWGKGGGVEPWFNA